MNTEIGHDALLGIGIGPSISRIGALTDFDAIGITVIVGIRIQEIDQSVGVRIRVPGIAPERQFITVDHPVAVRIGQLRIGTVNSGFIGVTDTVSVAVYNGHGIRYFIGEIAFVSTGIIGGNGKIIGLPLDHIGKAHAGLTPGVEALRIVSAGRAVIEIVARKIGLTVRIPCQGDIRCEGGRNRKQQ